MNYLIPIFLSFILNSPLEVPTINFNNSNSSIDLTTDTLTLVTNIEIINSSGYAEEYTDSDDIVLSDYIDGSIYYLYLEYDEIFINVERAYCSIEFEVTITIENQSGNINRYSTFYFHEIYLSELYEPEAFADYIYCDINYLAYDFELYDGYNRGFNEGLDVGYENGYKQGVTDGRLEGQAVNNVIEWFGSVWDALSGFLNLEIAPNITIGGIITIPIIIGVLFFGLKALIQ